MPLSVRTERFTVRSYEVDSRGRLTLPTICDWLQEAAGNHAGDLGVSTDQLRSRGNAWVLTRLRVDVVRYPSWRDEVDVETWPSGENGILADRDFVLHSPKGGEIARASSQWVVIDVARRRPVRLPREVVSIVPPGRPRAIADATPTLEEPEIHVATKCFNVRRGDLDLNRHVNNVRYVEWALEAVPEGLPETRECAGVEVQFRAESTLGDTIEAAAGPPGKVGADLLIRHRVTRLGDGTLLATLATKWRSA